jgi:hypothetical protein
MSFHKDWLLSCSVALLGILFGARLASAGGELVNMALTPESQVVSLGEPVSVTVEIKNATHHVVELDLGKNYRGNLLVTVSRPDGSVGRSAETSEGIYVPGKVALKPGGAYSDKLLLNEYESFDKTGIYKIGVSLKKEVTTDPSAAPQGKLEAEVKVGPRDPERLTSVCSGLLGKILSKGAGATTAASGLSHIHDKICFPQLSQALHGATGYRRAVIIGLASMDDSRVMGEFLAVWDSLLWDEQALAISEFEKQGRRQEFEKALAAAKKRTKRPFSDH